MKNTLIPSRFDICAIVILYHPDENLEDRLVSLKNQVNHLLLVDNNSTGVSWENIRSITKKYNFSIIRNPENVGIAGALNQGFEYVKTNLPDVEWCLTMDQDSQVYPNMVDSLLQGLSSYPNVNTVGIIGSNYIESSTDRILHSPTVVGAKYEEVDYLPTSGCLTSVYAYNLVGGFRTAFFIDYVDTEFCMRLRDIDYKVLIVPEVLMRHPLGNYRFSYLYKFLTDRDNITNYTPIRHYYWTRNGTRLILERFNSSVRWALKECYYLYLRRLVIVLLFEEKKVKKFVLILRGLVDGIRKKNSL